MVNNEWTQKGITAQAHFDPPGKFSDHSPCLVSLLGANDRGATPFKFFNMWAKHDNFHSLVRTSWGMRVEGTAMYKLCRKLKGLKASLKSLNNLHFSHISARSLAAEEKLQQAQLQLHNDPSNSQLQTDIQDLRAKALKLAEAEMSYCSQLAKAKFLKNSDTGTKFFHNMIKSRRMKSNIPSITLGDGNRSTSNNQISDAFVQHYMGLLGTKRVCMSLKPEIVCKGKR